MIHIVLYQPEIPPNTGNIMRLCSNTGAVLHLIKPLGFDLSEKSLKRARLDYHADLTPQTYESFEDYLTTIDSERLFLFSTKGTTNYCDVLYQNEDSFLFGPETRGLPQSILDQFPSDQIIRIPMLAEARSLNLSNAVAVATYEAWRQLGFVLGPSL